MEKVELQRPKIKLSRRRDCWTVYCRKGLFVFQPFGRGVHTAGNIIADNSGRSFSAMPINIIKKLKKYSVVLISEIVIFLRRKVY